MTIFKTVLEEAENEKYIRVNLESANLYVNRKPIIKDGEMVTKTEEFICLEDLSSIPELQEITDGWEILQVLYDKYKHSVPNGKQRKNYFFALDMDELSDEELISNWDRAYAKALLESYVLCASLQGWLPWKEESHWFWQNPNDKNCIVLKSWIQNPIQEKADD